jgi:predicted ATPase
MVFLAGDVPGVFSICICRSRPPPGSRRVFLAPPWPEIYVNDPERGHGFDAALAEYARLLDAYPSIGYDVFILPKVGLSERADFVLDTLAAAP